MSDHEPIQYAEGYDHQNIDERVPIKWAPVWASTIGLITLIVVSLGLVRAFELALSDHEKNIIHPNSVKPEFEQPSGVAPLNPAQVAQKKAYEARQEKLLTTYGWVNEEKKVARVPIERAKALTIEKYGKK